MTLRGVLILVAKRRRANASLNRDKTMFWGLTMAINRLARSTATTDY